MNDRFKFKAWDGTSLRDVVSIENNGCCGNGIHVTFESGSGLCGCTTLIQSTGRKDKNGKLIFESYIYELKVTGIETHVEYIDCVVEWNEFFCAFCWKRLTKDSDQLKFTEMQSKGILDKKYLGNIHENPELLNESKA